MSYTKLIDHIYSLKDTFFGVVYDEDSRTGRKIYDRFQIFLTETSRHYNYPRKIVHMAEQISEALFVAENIDVRHDLFAVGNLIGIVIGNVDKISSLICDNQNQYKNSVGDIDDESYLTECVNRHKLKTYNYHNIYSYTETRNLVSFFNEQTIKSDIIHFAQFNRYGIIDYIPNIIEDIKRGTDIKKINKKIFDLRFKR